MSDSGSVTRLRELEMSWREKAKDLRRMHLQPQAEICELHADELAAALAPAVVPSVDNGNLFIFCDHVEMRYGCVRGAGHNGPHALCLPPYPQGPVILRDTLTRPQGGESDGKDECADELAAALAPAVVPSVDERVLNLIDQYTHGCKKRDWTHAVDVLSELREKVSALAAAPPLVAPVAAPRCGSYSVHEGQTVWCEKPADHPYGHAARVPLTWGRKPGEVDPPVAAPVQEKAEASRA